MLAGKRTTEAVERFHTTGKLPFMPPKRPTIIEGIDPTQEFIERHFDTVKEE